MELLNRLLELARVFIEGRGLPFLGAGVSMTARVADDSSLEPTVSFMIKQLVNQNFYKLKEEERKNILYQLGACPSSSCSCPHRLCDPNSSAKKTEISKESFLNGVNDQLGKLCEILIQRGFSNQADVVSALRIKDFSKLEPLPAHYYLAFLAQETLVNEIITTNYDCCLERALAYVAGESFQGNGAKNNRAVSIFNLTSYRSYGARRLFPYNLASVLRIYKINGCAAELRNNQQHADSILLTDRQLQHMDDRTWARDLLRDRARSRAFIFSGFGSDEPQVRFSVNRLLEEFSQPDSDNSDPQNSIWLHLFNDKRSFSQNQIMDGFWGSEKRINEHTFSGKDLEEINKLSGKEPAGDKLPADIFWQVLYQVVFLALVDRYTRPSYPGWRWLARLDSPARSVGRRYELLSWLDPAGIGRRVLEDQPPLAQQEVPNPLQVVDRLVGFKDFIPGMPSGMKVTGIPLALWMRCLEGKNRPPTFGWHNLPECYYNPLLRQTNLVISLLMTICCFGQNSGPPPLQVEFPDAYISPPLLFLIFHNQKFLLYTDFTKTFVVRAGAYVVSRTVLAGYFVKSAMFGPCRPVRRSFTHDIAPTASNSVGEVKIRLLLPFSIQMLIRQVSTDGGSAEETLTGDPFMKFMKFFVRIIIEDWTEKHRQTRYLARLTRLNTD